jgi:hypothetical protein
MKLSWGRSCTVRFTVILDIRFGNGTRCDCDDEHCPNPVSGTHYESKLVVYVSKNLKNRRLVEAPLVNMLALQ